MASIRLIYRSKLNCISLVLNLVVLTWHKANSESGQSQRRNHSSMDYVADNLDDHVQERKEKDILHTKKSGQLH